MFVSEHILLNTTISVLQRVEKKETWETRDIIFTDRALYIFAQVQNPREQTINYLSAPFERLNMVNFMAKGSTDEFEQIQEPAYLKFLPRQNGPFYLVVELHNEESGKIRLVSLKSEEEKQAFINLFNLISCFRRYQATIIDEGGDKDSGPQFISDWVRSYFSNEGIMTLPSEILKAKLIKYLLWFGEKNPSIKGLIFDDALYFSLAGKRNQREQINHELTHIVIMIIDTFKSGNSVTELRFKSNQLDDMIFKNIGPCFSSLCQLRILEVTQNAIGDETLACLSQLLQENQQIEEIILSNNKLGNSGSEKHLVSFLEAFLLELKDPQKLDLSCNFIGDVCLEPIIFYLLANHNCTIKSLNVEQNSFTNYAKRTLAQACLYCPNPDLKVKYGPISLTSGNMQVAVNRRLKDSEENKHQQYDTAHQQLKGSANGAVTISITRKAANQQTGMRWLPIGKYQEELNQIKQRIDTMCLPDKRNTIYSEDIHEMVQEIMELEIEFPKHLMQPLFHLLNQKIAKAIQASDLYQIEILLDALYMMNSTNKQAEVKYEELKLTAMTVSTNLTRAINMEIHDDNELLKILVENLKKAKEIGMRGEMIDMAITLKALSVKLLQEMLAKTSNSDEEDDPTKQVFMMKEEDLRRSVYDSYYDRFVEYEDKNLSTELEPNIALHPYRTDYLSIAGLNLNYLKKNMALSRRLISEEETYSLLNIYTRCAFLLFDLKRDFSKSLEFNNARDDKLLRFSRLLFRYRHNLDNLFKPKPEPFVCQAFQKQTKDKMLKVIGQPSISGNNNIKTYSGYERMDVDYSPHVLTKPLVTTNTALKQAAIKFSTQLIEIQKSSRSKALYKRIRTLFEDFVIRSSTLLFEDMADEFYWQLYRQSNTTDPKVKIKPIFLVMVFLSRYMTPSRSLINYYEEWLIQKKNKIGSLERLIKHTLVNFKILMAPENATPPERRSLINWPPSSREIEAFDESKSIKIKVLFPNGDSREYEIDEATTVETLMRQRIFRHEKRFQGHLETQFHWLYSMEEDYDHFPMPLSKEKRLLKLLYLDEKHSDQVQSNQMGNMRSSSLLRQKTRKVSEADKDEAAIYDMLILRLRKRIFSSLHSMPKFTSLNKEARDFLFHQIKSDYTDFEILRKPMLSAENASMLAALALQVKRYKKILTSKDNTLKKEEVQKHMNYCMPQSFQRDRAFMKTADQKILQCFEQQNIKDLTIEEAQEQFLTLISSYRFVFGSHFIVRRKPPQGMLLLKKNAVQGLQKRATNVHMRKELPDQLKEKMKNKKAKKKGHVESKFASNDSSNDYESSSSSSGSTSQEQEDKSANESHDEESMESEEFSNASSLHEVNSTALDEIFPGVHTEILLVITYEQVIFLDGTKRDKPILEIKLEDLLYVMGKGETLKIAFQMNQNLLNKEKKQTYNRQKAQTNENYQMDIIDVHTIFITPNARVIAEDIIGYIQVNLVEKTKAKDYHELMKPNFVDFLTQEDISHRSIDHENPGEGSKGENQKSNINVVVNDDLLLGITNFKQKSAKQLKEMGSKNQQDSSFRNSSQMSIENSWQSKEESDDDQFSDESSRNERAENMRKLAPAQRYERKITQRAGHQFKFRKPDFMIYMRRHPTYTSSNIGGSQLDQSQDRIAHANTLQGARKSVIQARETITGQSFVLENNTIDEESDFQDSEGNTQQSPTEKIKSKSSLSNSNFASLPRRGDSLDRIDEEMEDDGRDNYTSAANQKPMISPIVGSQEKQGDSRRTPSHHKQQSADITMRANAKSTIPAPPPIRPQAPAPRPPAPVGRPGVPRPPVPRAPVPRAPVPIAKQESVSDNPYADETVSNNSAPPKLTHLVPSHSKNSLGAMSSGSAPIKPNVPVSKPQPPKPAPFDYASFMKSAQQTEQLKQESANSEASKLQISQGFDKASKAIPRVSKNFENAGKDTLKNNMATLLAGIPPPP